MDYLIAWLLSMLKRSARHKSAKKIGSDLVFPLSFGVKVSVGIVTLALSIFTVLIGAELIRKNGPIVIILILLLLLFGILACLPGKIVLDERGISQRYFWRPCKRIEWREVSVIEHDPSGGSIIIYGRHLPLISFSPYLNGQEEFKREMLSRSPVKQIVEGGVTE